MKTITNIIYPTFAVFTLACLAFAPQARAACQHGCDTGNINTFLGNDALINNTTGSSDTAVGASALQYNNVGVGNTAVGFRALWLNTGNANNTAIGANALGNNIGFENTALGTNA